MNTGFQGDSGVVFGDAAKCGKMHEEARYSATIDNGSSGESERFLYTLRHACDSSAEKVCAGLLVVDVPRAGRVRGH
jgi:hypothetical protein